MKSQALLRCLRPVSRCRSVATLSGLRRRMSTAATAAAVKPNQPPPNMGTDQLSRKEKRRMEAQAALAKSPAARGSIIQGKTGEWEIVVGLEIHAQIDANTKLFSDAPASYGMFPNTQVAWVDEALPGTLPVINQHCVEQAMKTGLAIRGKVNTWSAFDRKHYFYCDMPNGYQITQYYKPIVEGGRVVLSRPDSSTKEVRIERIQLEIDSGKSMHDQHPNMTYVDLNRAGSALMEIVTFPDLNSAAETAQFVKKVQFLMQHIGTCDGNMEEGSMRVDANVSVRRKGTKDKMVRCEIKNLNSIQALIRGIDYEAHRQVELLEAGTKLYQETRFWDPVNRVTVTGRRKEDDLDYRFFPEPDLPPLTVEETLVERVAKSLPELPDEIQQRLLTEYKLTPYEADVLANHPSAYPYFLEASKGRNPNDIAKWITNDIFGLLNDSEFQTINDIPITAAQLGQLVDLVSQGKISGRIAKELLEFKFENNDRRNPADIVQEKGWYQIQDMDSLRKMCEEVVAKNPEVVAEIQGGRPRKLKFLVGMVMKQTEGKAPGPAVTAIFEELLNVKAE